MREALPGLLLTAGRRSAEQARRIGDLRVAICRGEAEAVGAGGRFATEEKRVTDCLIFVIDLLRSCRA
jgi:hypothetical protein